MVALATSTVNTVAVRIVILGGDANRPAAAVERFHDALELHPLPRRTRLTTVESSTICSNSRTPPAGITTSVLREQPVALAFERSSAGPLVIPRSSNRPLASVRVASIRLGKTDADVRHARAPPPSPPPRCRECAEIPVPLCPPSLAPPPHPIADTGRQERAYDNGLLRFMG